MLQSPLSAALRQTRRCCSFVPSRMAFKLTLSSSRAFFGGPLSLSSSPPSLAAGRKSFSLLALGLEELGLEVEARGSFTGCARWSAR